MKRHPATQRNATPFFSNEGSVICPAALRDGHAESVDSGECAVTLSSERLVVARAASGCHLIAVLPMMTVSGTLLELLAAHGRSLKAADRSSRDLNARSELSAQLARFETIVRALQQSDSADGDSSAAIAELDLCGALTRMTFSPYTEPLSDDDGTLQTMRRALKRDESADIFLGASPPSALPELDLDEADLDVLVSLLPDAADAKRLTRWYSSESYYHQNALWMDENIVYSPLDFPVLQEQLNSRRNLEADVTAECHAFCAVVTVSSAPYSNADNAAWATVREPSFAQRAALLHAAAATRALALADHLDHPTLPILRALFFLAQLFCTVWPSTDHLSRGLAFCQTGLSLALDLGWHEEPEALSLAERHARRGVISALVRMQLTMPSSIGRTPLLDPALLDVQTPDYFEDADLPPRWLTLARLMPADYELVKLRHDLAKEQYAVSLMLSPEQRPSEAELHERTQSLDSLVARVPARYGYSEDEHGHIIPNAQLLQVRDLVQRAYASNAVAMAKIVLHRSSASIGVLGRRKSSIADQSELVRHVRIALLSWAELARLGALHVALFAVSFSAHIAIVLAFLYDVDPSLAGHDHLYTEATEALARLDEPSNRHALPSAVRRLVVIMRTLLSRPRVRTTEHAGKRQRSDIGERITSSERVDGTWRHKRPSIASTSMSASSSSSRTSDSASSPLAAELIPVPTLHGASTAPVVFDETIWASFDFVTPMTAAASESPA